MTSKEYKRLKDFIHNHQEHVRMWYGWFNLHLPYARKMGIPDFQSMKMLSDTHSECFKHPANHIKSVKLWIENHGHLTKYF